MSNSHGELKFPHYVTWEVPNFLNLPHENDHFLESPKFYFDGGTWCLRLFPRCYRGYRSCDSYFTDIWLVRWISSSHEQYSCEIGLVNNDGHELKIERERDFHVSTFGDQILFVNKFYARRSMVERNKNTFAPRGTLTVFCRLLSVGISSVGTSSPAATEHAATQTEMEGAASFVISEPPSCGKDTPSVEKLRSDYQKLLKSGAESDLLVLVSGREFRAHRGILRARSPVFDALFGRETEEKPREKVVIEDLDPDAFRDFLEYLYTGRVETLSDENVFRLYAAADKYDVQELKSEALDYMQSTIVRN